MSVSRWYVRSGACGRSRWWRSSSLDVSRWRCRWRRTPGALGGLRAWLSTHRSHAEPCLKMCPCRTLRSEPRTVGMFCATPRSARPVLGRRLKRTWTMSRSLGSPDRGHVPVRDRLGERPERHLGADDRSCAARGYGTASALWNLTYDAGYGGPVSPCSAYSWPAPAIRRPRRDADARRAGVTAAEGT
jgi:hypothetical protein